MANSGNPQPTARVESTTRVDHAHNVEGFEPIDSLPAEPSMDLLQAIAGFDARLANHQMRTQALELAAMLREKQQLLEQRESELNARSAILENEWRTARLRQQAQHGAPLALDATTAPQTSTNQTAQDFRSTTERSLPTKDRVAADHPWPADHLFAGDENLFTWHDDKAQATSNSPANPSLKDSATFADDSNDDASDDNRSSLEAEIDLTSSDTSLEFDFQQEWEQLQEQRRQLQEKESSLQRRKMHLEHTHDEVLTMHREALEMRLATEQAWADLLPHLSRPDLMQSIARMRTQLADHYRLAHDALQRRKDELLELREQLQHQEQRLRQHRREIQMWADRRYDEIEARAARLTVRERELDLMEADLQSQSLQWQRQRELYREEIERLSWQVRDQSLSPASH